MRSQYAKKVDRSQSAIVKAVRKLRAQVRVTNMGLDFPDLLIGRRSHGWKLVEVKELDGHFSRGQLEFLAGAHGPVDVVTSADDAILSVTTGRALTGDQKAKISVWLMLSPNQESIRVKKLLGIIGREIDKPGTNGSEK